MWDLNELTGAEGEEPKHFESSIFNDPAAFPQDELNLQLRDDAGTFRVKWRHMPPSDPSPVALKFRVWRG